MTPATSFDVAEATTGVTGREDEAGADLTSWWALRRAAHGALRRHDDELLTDGGNACQLLTLTTSGPAALAGERP